MKNILILFIVSLVMGPVAACSQTYLFWPT